MKTCKRCEAVKDDDAFYNHRAVCKECVTAQVRANYLENREQYHAYERGRAKLPHRIKAASDYAKTETGRARVKSAKRAYIERNPVKRAAHVALGNAIRDATVWKSPSCMAPDCFSQDRLHGHHTHYSDPMCVVWLCNSCHALVHREHDQRYGKEQATW